MSTDRANVLRVLNGRLAGTEKALPPEGRLSIGHQFWQDVVIRDPATKGIAIDFHLQEDGGAHVTVLSGEAWLLGSTLQPGQTALLPPYVPFSIGGVALAWGDPESVRWTDATGLATSVPVVPAPVPTPREQAVAMAGRAGERVAEVLNGWRIAAIAGLGVLLVAAAAGPSTIDALGLRGSQATRVERALDQAGLEQLRAVHDPAGGVVVTGVVANEADRTKAQDALRTTAIPGRIEVQTGQELAQATADVARIHGLAATARPLGGANVELRTTPLAPDQRLKLVHAVKADVGAVQQVVVRDDLPPEEDVPIKTVSDATKKVSTVVSGDPAYIQTADGARYFPGAMMPSGHRLVAIQGQTVLLEKNGRETRLTF